MGLEVNYLLALMTDGRREYLERTLSALAFLDPEPAINLIHNDGGSTPYHDLLAATGRSWEIQDSRTRVGHCRSYAQIWQRAAQAETEFVLVLEDDHVLLRPVALAALARVLTERPWIAQMALLRTPWGEEIPFGGFIPRTPGRYERLVDGQGAEWIETTRNWTCAPALFRSSLSREVPWPAEPGCETAIGPAILTTYPEARFGIWGAGEPWVAHVGVARTAEAYGY